MFIFRIRESKLMRLSKEITRLKSELEQNEDEKKRLKLVSLIKQYRLLKDKTYFNGGNSSAKNKKK